MITTISGLILFGYIAYVIYSKGIPSSISESYHLIKYPILFQLALTTSCSLLMIELIEQCKEYEYLGFLTAATGLLIGFAPSTYNKFEYTIHKVAAITCGVCSQLCVLVIDSQYLFMWLFILPLLTISNKKLFITEVGCITTLLFSLN